MGRFGGGPTSIGERKSASENRMLGRFGGGPTSIGERKSASEDAGLKRGWIVMFHMENKTPLGGRRWAEKRVDCDVPHGEQNTLRR